DQRKKLAEILDGEGADEPDNSKTGVWLVKAQLKRENDIAFAYDVFEMKDAYVEESDFSLFTVNSGIEGSMREDQNYGLWLDGEEHKGQNYILINFNERNTELLEKIEWKCEPVGALGNEKYCQFVAGSGGKKMKLFLNNYGYYKLTATVPGGKKGSGRKEDFTISFNLCQYCPVTKVTVYEENLKKYADIHKGQPFSLYPYLNIEPMSEDYYDSESLNPQSASYTKITDWKVYYNDGTKAIENDVTIDENGKITFNQGGNFTIKGNIEKGKGPAGDPFTTQGGTLENYPVTIGPVDIEANYAYDEKMFTADNIIYNNSVYDGKTRIKLDISTISENYYTGYEEDLTQREVYYCNLSGAAKKDSDGDYIWDDNFRDPFAHYNEFDEEQQHAIIDILSDTYTESPPKDAGIYFAVISTIIHRGSAEADVVGYTAFQIVKHRLNDNGEITLEPYSELQESWPYTGEEIKPNYSVKVDWIVLGADSTEPHYDNNVKIGTATLTLTGKGNYKGTLSKTFEIVDYDYNHFIPLYNGSETKKAWYPKKVAISSKGYDVSESQTDSFAESYDLTGRGEVSKDLYFRFRETGTVIPAHTVSANIDPDAPTGSVTVMKKSFNSLADKDSFLGYTNTAQSFEITGKDPAGGSGLSTVSYFVSTSFYGTEEEIKKAAGDKWAVYDETKKPGISANHMNYIYAKLADTAGNETYISTSGIFHDDIVPSVTKIASSKVKTDTATVTFTGSDNASGIANYYLLVKKKSDTAPKADEVVKKGTKNSSNVFSLTGLTENTSYILYGLAVDRAGNTGSLRSQSMKTKKESSDDDSSSSSSSSSSAGAATAAASSSSKSSSSSAAKGSASSSAKPVDKVKDSSDDDEEEEDGTLVPYIESASQGIATGVEDTGGWGKIMAEAGNANTTAENSEIHINMNGSTVVPASLFNEITGKKVTCYFELEDDLIWAVNGTSITSRVNEDVDFGLRWDEGKIPERTLMDLAGSEPRRVFSLNHDGPFPFDALLYYEAEEQYIGRFADLYFYNEADEKLELMDEAQVPGTKRVIFTFNHASDYVVVYWKDSPLQALAAASKTPSDIDRQKFQEANISKVSKLGSLKNSTLWTGLLVILCIGLCAAIILIPGKPGGKRRKRRAA
ncbi:MAG: hypothetical protein K5985_08490, partial [Lachnospiraceae bacterium]|nr:hypothetical protein [Lachnospiraceae bacterium]